MAKKKAEKKTKRDTPHIDAFLNLEGRVMKLEQRLDRIVDAIDKSKKVKGL